MKARDADEKAAVALKSLQKTFRNELETMQTRLFEKAKAFRAEHSHTHINSMDHSKQHLAESDQIPGWVLAGWCGDDACEQGVKEETKFTTRNIPFDPPTTKNTCLHCGKEAKHTVWFSRAY